MEEIAQQFKEELQELLDRYKTRLSVPRIMSIAQDVFHKTLSIKYHPELHNLTEEHIQQIVNSGPSFLEQHALKEEFIAHPPVTGKWSSEHNTLQRRLRRIELEGSASHDAVTGIDLDSSMMHLGGSDDK